ncbi:MAG TPA: glycosyltransferase [candidate division Zixibacteria bacterium]|nr:glycosyltransferase [candidate division Zixibacteria bacterium]
MDETTSRLRLLLIDEEFPYPLTSGKRLRTYNLLRELSRRCDITTLAYGDPDSEGFRRFERDGLTPVAVPAPDRRQSGLRFYWRLFSNLFSPYPYIVTSHTTRRFHRRLRQLLARHSFDLVLCEWTPYARFVKDLPGVRKVITAHNIEAAIWRRYEQQETQPLRRLYIRLQRTKVEAFEARCFGWVDGAIAVSESEARQIAELGVPYPPAVVENGVDVGYFTAPADDPDPGQIVFSGAMDWRPNQDAALWFVQEIFPLLRRARPNLAVTIVGRDPVRRIRELGRVEGVTVTGTVADVRPYLARAAVFIVPLRIGGGSRLKILEAMAMRKAVVSTSVGAEGLRVAADENIMIADDAPAFAQAVLRCLGEPDLRRRLGENGRRLVEREYRWDILGHKMYEYLCRVMQQK